MTKPTATTRADPGQLLNGSGHYDASHIAVLTGLEPVRQRPAMYVGSTGADGVRHLVHEVVQNAVDEAMAGWCSHIAVEVHADGSCSVRDDGRGIPVDDHPALGRPACEVVFTTLHAGGKFGRDAYDMAGGLHGVGISCVNALSQWLTLDVWRDGQHHQQAFSRGLVTRDLAALGPTEARGTRVHFLPDPEIFGDAVALDPDVLARRLQEQAFLHPGISIDYTHGPGGRRERFQYDTGIVGFVQFLNRDREVFHDHPVHCKGRADGIDVEAALQWTTAYAEDISTYVNSIFTSNGGTHLDGLKSALTRAINRYAVDHGLLDERHGETVAGYDIREGLTCVLSIRMQEPQFEGQTKSSLTSARATAAVEQVLGEQLRETLERQPEVAAAIVGKALEASRARVAARRASERARYQSIDPILSKEIYQIQFGIRSKNWHESARWITDRGLLDSHAELCRKGPDALVLDVCCGSGVVGDAFRARVGRIVGLDLTPEMIALARTRLDEVHQGNVYEMPFEDETFDMVVNREVLHLLPRPDIPVGHIFRVLKPGGQFVVGQLVPYSDIDAPWMFRILKKKQPLFFNNFTGESFRALLADAGFVDIEATEYLQWEDIDVWIDTHETPNLHRHEIRDLYHHAPAEVRAVHPFEILPSGQIRDQWRWLVFSAFKPGDPAQTRP